MYFFFFQKIQAISQISLNLQLGIRRLYRLGENGTYIVVSILLCQIMI